MIGIMDSGVGGLGVFLEIKRLNPNVPIVYYADSANFPYGTKSEKELLSITMKVAQFLINQGITILVVACNSATVTVINNLRDKLDVDIVGIEPAIKIACNHTKNGRVGILATKRTICSHDSISLMSDKCTLYQAVSAELVSKIEHEDKISKDDLEKSIKQLLEREVDSIVLGCTHYYFIKNDFENLYPKINFLEPSDIVAQRVLKRYNSEDYSSGHDKIFVSGSIDTVSRFIKTRGIDGISVRKV